MTCEQLRVIEANTPQPGPLWVRQNRKRKHGTKKGESPLPARDRGSRDCTEETKKITKSLYRKLFNNIPFSNL